VGSGELDEELIDIAGVPPQEEESQRDPTPNSSAKAEAETAMFNAGAPVGEWKKDADEREHKRNQKFRDAFEDLIIFVVKWTVRGFMAMALVWALNIALGRWSWLNEDQMRDLKDLLAGGLIIALVSDHIKRRMN